MTTQTQQANSQKEITYFNLHTTGLAYVNRIREVSVKRGTSFYACTLAMLRGSSENPEYTFIDVRVSGEEAISLIKRCEKACQEEKKILAGVVVGDIYPETFIYEKGKHKGETGVTMKGRLLRIKFLKIDGVLKYQEKPANQTDNKPAQESAEFPTSEAA